MNSNITQTLFAVYVLGRDAATMCTSLVQPANQLLAQYWMRQQLEGLATLSTTDKPSHETPLRQQWAAVAGRLLDSGWWWLAHSSTVSLTLETSYG